MQKQHIAILDGIRGLLAFWVMYGHLKMFVLMKEPLIGSVVLAVDVFMFLSGFLMAYHWLDRASKFPSLKEQSFDFYIRRFFRIAPLYYLLLVVAWLGQDYFLKLHHEIRAINPPPWAAAEATFIKPTDYTLNLRNFLAHFTFIFGAIPKYANNNPLPDWSISLEMQFYAVFPFLMLGIEKLGKISALLLTIVLTYLTNHFFGLYLEDGPLGNFPQPSMLLFKLNIFLCGIFVARCVLDGFKDKTGVILASVLLFNCHPRLIAILIAIVLLLAFDPFGKETLSRILSHKIFRFLGDMSYSVYLLHMLILLPVLHTLMQTTWFLKQRGLVQLGIASVLIFVPVYGLSILLSRLVELPGISLGRRMASKVRKGKNSVPSVVQES